MSDTPETDEEEQACLDNLIYRRKPGYPPGVTSGLARKLERERDEARKKAAMWKANHDNQVALKSAIIQRPDLKDRAERVQMLIAERDEARRLIREIFSELCDLQNERPHSRILNLIERIEKQP